MKKSKKGLGMGMGKGLGALISEADKSYNDSVVEIDINKIEPNKNQPRKFFDEELLKELSDSIKEFGVVQPIIVKDEGDFYSIIAGERRWRASRMAELDTIPVIVKDYTDLEILQVALIENIQRKDLNPIEEANCYKRLIDEFLFTQESISTKVSKSRSTIVTLLNLLKLDEKVQTLIMENRISSGHGKSLLLLNKEDQFMWADKIYEEDLSVKKASELIKLYLKTKDEQPIKKEIKVYKNVEDSLNSILGTKVSVKSKDDKGKIEIEFYNEEDLDRLMLMFNKL